MWVLLVLGVIAAISFFYLRGENLAAFDRPAGQSFASGAPPNAEHKAVAESLKTGMGSLGIGKLSGKERLYRMREYMDNLSVGKEFTASFTPVDAGGIAAEWVLAPGANPARRLLYLHGGAFTMGSAQSHRNITRKFSEISNAAVLAIDYRLMPEHPRRSGIEDCRSAYHWILQNGPNGAAPLEALYLAGDSAGGNLALSTVAWARDNGLRAANAVVALSPATDSSFTSPSLKTNIRTDTMLGPVFGKLGRVPVVALWWLAWAQMRMSPGNPVISPVFGNLSGLPPILVHASEAEMLLDDARRYVNKAAAAGSPVKLQTWAHVVHVWHMFDPELTEAREAFEQIRLFLAEYP